MSESSRAALFLAALAVLLISLPTLADLMR